MAPINPYTYTPASQTAATPTGRPQTGYGGPPQVQRVPPAGRGAGRTVRRRRRGSPTTPQGMNSKGQRVASGRDYTPPGINPEGLESLPGFSDFGEAAALGRVPGVGSAKKRRGFNA